MAPKNKPAFLKTFSEFTIDELRSMPLTKVLSLFATDVHATFTKPTDLPKPKQKQKTSKKVTPSDKNKQTLADSGLTKAIKRIFTPGPMTYPTDKNTKNIAIDTVLRTIQEPIEKKISKSRSVHVKQSAEKVEKPQEETIVFSSHEEQIPLTHTP